MKTADMLGEVLKLTDIVLTVAIKLQSVSNVLKKAHVEGWTEDDARWDAVWEEADADFENALAKFKA
jgi:hypothetical protein